MSTNTLTTEQPKPQRLIAHGNDAFTDTALFEHQWRIAAMFSKSDLCPKQYQGSPENCMIAVSMAQRLQCDPMMFMQNSYVVHGRPGIEAKLAIALANQSGVFRGPIRYRVEGTGDNRSWTAFATVAATGDEIEMTISWAMVKAEKWDSNPKWKTMADVMGRYRAAMFLIRTHCPEVIMGLPSREELDDVGDCEEQPRRKVGARRAAPLKLTAVVDQVTEGINTVSEPADERDPPEFAERFADCTSEEDCEEIYKDLMAEDPTMQLEYAAARDWKKGQVKNG